MIVGYYQEINFSELFLTRPMMTSMQFNFETQLPFLSRSLFLRMMKSVASQLPSATPPPRLQFPFSYSSNDVLNGRRECLEIGDGKRRRVWLTPDELHAGSVPGKSKSFISRSAHPSMSEYPASFSYRNARIHRWLEGDPASFSSGVPIHCCLSEVVDQDVLSDVSMEDVESLASLAELDTDDLVDADDGVSIASVDSLTYSIDSELFGELIPVDSSEELGSYFTGSVRRSRRLSSKPRVSYSCYINSDDNYDREDDPDYHP